MIILDRLDVVAGLGLIHHDLRHHHGRTQMIWIDRTDACTSEAQAQDGQASKRYEDHGVLDMLDEFCQLKLTTST